MLTKAAGLESEVVLTHDFSIRARSAGLQVLRWNATMYREVGARRRVYFNPQHASGTTRKYQCMLVNQLSSVFHNGEG